jgi:glutamate racemase
VGVLATAGTFESQRYASLMARFAQDVVLYENRCEGLVELIEAGAIETPATESLLQGVLLPMLAEGVDTLVLGCTHYPFVHNVIARIVGSDVVLIDPAPAVAQQTERMLAARHLLHPGPSIGAITAFTSGEPLRLAQPFAQLLGMHLPVYVLPPLESTPPSLVATVN